MDLLTRIEASLEFMDDGGPIGDRVDFANLREVLEGSREALLKLDAAIDQLAERDADLSLARHDYATLLERWREEQQHVLHWRTRAESAESRLGALQKAIEADLSDAKAVCGGDGEGCSAYRDYYDSAERRHRKCGTCPMDALFHVRAALNPLPTGDRDRNG